MVGRRPRTVRSCSPPDDAERRRVLGEEHGVRDLLGGARPRHPVGGRARKRVRRSDEPPALAAEQRTAPRGRDVLDDERRRDGRHRGRPDRGRRPRHALRAGELPLAGGVERVAEHDGLAGTDATRRGAPRRSLPRSTRSSEAAPSPSPPRRPRAPRRPARSSRASRSASRPLHGRRRRRPGSTAPSTPRREGGHREGEREETARG